MAFATAWVLLMTSRRFMAWSQWKFTVRSLTPRMIACLGSSIWPDACGPIRKETIMKIVTSLSFQGQCREAFEFYAKVLGGKITAAMPYGDAPPGMPISGEKYKTWLMHCWLEVGDQALVRSALRRRQAGHAVS